MATHDFDVVIIGSGPGGYVAAIRAAQLGLKTACIEKSPTLGGTCLNVGCIPSKTLLQTTEHYAWIKKEASTYGIHVENPSIDFNAIMERKQKVVSGLTNGIASHFKKHGIARLQGTARFVDPFSIEVVGEETTKVSAAHFIIATGSYPTELPFLKFDEKQIVSSTGMLSLESIPKRIVVVGGGVIGVELASVYNRLGSEIHIVEMLESITITMDNAISRQLQQSLTKQGINFYLKAKVNGAKRGDAIEVSVEHENKNLNLSGDVVLVAVGRKPYTKDLNLEAAGLATDPKGFIPIDSNLRTSQSHIFAIGDVVEGAMLAHRAFHEGIAAAELIAGLQPQINYLSIPNVIYTHPEAASVGFTEDEAKASNLKIITGTSYFRGNARARCSGDIDGLVKIIGDENSGRLIGLHIIGANASEMIQEGVIAFDKGATLQEIANACHAHPTLSEALMEAAQQALGWAIHG